MRSLKERPHSAGNKHNKTNRSGSRSDELPNANYLLSPHSANSANKSEPSANLDHVHFKLTNTSRQEFLYQFQEAKKQSPELSDEQIAHQGCFAIKFLKISFVLNFFWSELSIFNPFCQTVCESAAGETLRNPLTNTKPATNCCIRFIRGIRETTNVTINFTF